MADKAAIGCLTSKTEVKPLWAAMSEDKEGGTLSGLWVIGEGLDGGERERYPFGLWRNGHLVWDRRNEMGNGEQM